MKHVFLLLAAVAFTAFAGREVATRVDFASQPEGARVFIDGTERGIAPLTLFDITPGFHRVKFRLPGYEDRDRFCTVEPNRPIQESAVMNPVKGILLLQSEPEGCNITIDGISAGTTPRLVTTLDAREKHRVVMEKAGFRPAEFDVRFNGRKPVVRNEKMLLDAGVLEISSDPVGAEVMVNGISHGLAPVVVRDVPKGSAIVKLRKEGFEDETRELRIVAGDHLTLPVQLKALPGTLYLSSVPDGARFYINDEFRGVSPVVISNVKPGTYSVRAELKGFGTDVRNVEVGNGASPRVEFRLSNVMGRIEVVSSPVGAQVYIDNRLVGTTKSGNPAALKSDPFPIENILEGEHAITLKAEGYTTVVKHPKVVNSKTEHLNVRMKRFFKPDVIIVTPTGDVKGRLIKNGREYVEIEVSLGVTKAIPRDNIRKLEFIEE